MLNNIELYELKSILQAQHNIILTIEMSLSEIETSINHNSIHKKEIEDLQSELNFIEQNVNLLEPLDVEFLDENKIKNYYEINKRYTADLELISFNTWEQFVRDTLSYNIRNNIDLIIPYQSMLTEEELILLKSEDYQTQYRWDKWDYMFVGLAGLLGSLLDILIVKIPIDITSGKYVGQTGSEITKWLRNIKFPDNIQKWLEIISKVPYDQTGGGDHRIDTPGHDPVLGFIFGLLDIMRCTSTTIKNGDFVISQKNDLGNHDFIASFIQQLLHLISDVATKKGLPVPFASLFRALNIGSFERSNGKTATISQLTLWMYHNGYDLRHFMTMGITPGTIEIILRAYLMIRHYVEKGEVELKLANNPKYRSMILSAHSIACLSNAGKVFIYQGNPLAINYTEWLALIHYLVPSVKYWVFDKTRLKLEHLEKINENGWTEILENSNFILQQIYSTESIIFEMGIEH